MSDTATFARGGEFATARRGGIDPYEMAQIVQLRGRGVGVQNIAKMLGRPTTAIEAFFSLSRAEEQPPEPEPEGRRPPTYHPQVRPWIRVLDRIVAETAAEFGRPEALIFSIRSQSKYTPMRRAAWVRARKETGLSFPALGSYFNRDHTSILSAWHMEMGKEA